MLSLVRDRMGNGGWLDSIVIQLMVISSPGSMSLVATADMARSFLVNLLYALGQSASDFSYFPF